MQKRKIEFRAWDEENKKYYYQDSSPVWLLGIDIVNQMAILQSVKDGTWQTSVVLEQWTGLVDANGKKIFEGDVVQWNKDKKRVRTVSFIEGNFQLEGFGFSIPISGFDMNNWTIINNKHELPNT